MQLHSSISVQIEQNAIKFKIAPRKHESILNIFFANNQRPPNNLVSIYATVMIACFVAHSIDYQLYHYVWNRSETEHLQF